jgi:hypothetical protein
MLSLLALLRFEPHDNRSAMEASIGQLMLQAELNQGTVIAYEHDQLALFIPDSVWGLPALRHVVTTCKEQGFCVYGAIVQPVGSTGAPKQMADFTERTVETLLRLGSAVLANEIGISPKMMSLLQLSTPQFAPWFVNPGARAFPVLVMA